LKSIEEILALSPVVPVLVLDDATKAVPLARALTGGGIRVVEVALRTEAAFEAIERIAAEVPDAAVGAGTVVKPEQFERLARIGAVFAFSPGATADLFEAAAASPLPFVPGIATASELMLGLERGYQCFQFFPARPMGGVAALQSFVGPFPRARFCPTGGISGADFTEYLRLRNVLAVGGYWLTPPAAVAAGDWNTVAALARGACAAAVAATAVSA
jgi:2-dehydro-3-deoxyphosphogluconate aldolase/(4S)-4-hydroxy-2-oxoglutarate aldolase